jgi:CheY-like chemotaxis protein
MTAGLASRPGESSGRAARAGPGPRILVVDDHDVFRGVICSLLRGAGYEVASAATRDEALALAAPEERLDLLLVDVRLRADLGPHVVGEILTKRSQLPVIYMSGYERPVALVGAEEPFLRKPFSPEELLSMVASALRLDPGDPFMQS